MSAFADVSILHLSMRKDLSDLVRHVFSRIGMRVISSEDPAGLSELAVAEKPDFAIIDAQFPEADCYALCGMLQSHPATAQIPVVVATGSSDPLASVQRYFMSGIVESLEEPFETTQLIDLARRLTETAQLWRDLESGCVTTHKLRICLSALHFQASADSGEPGEGLRQQVTPLKYGTFKELLVTGEGLAPEDAGRLLAAPPFQLYEASARSGIARPQLARQIAEFIGTKYIRYITPEQVIPGVLPPRFCRANRVLPVRMKPGRYSLVMSNPFEWELIAYLQELNILRQDTQVFITKPENILKFFEDTEGGPEHDAYEEHGGKGAGAEEPAGDKEQVPLLEKGSAEELTTHILAAAVQRRASDIHIEPKTLGYLVRFRIDGDLHDFTFLKEAGGRLISRFKVKGGMDIGECRKPQDGTLSLVIRNEHYNLRLATSSTPNGESMIIRLLHTDVRVKDVMGLGMSDRQARLIKDLTGRKAGLILTVGPAGSGKTTTVYSILSHIDCLSRSLLSVEDPVEYTIPFATQQQVNEKSGLTYEALLKASVRQDPNVLFIGEIRDQASAKIALDFTSTGHLTLSTMHTSNATTAIFRLERLGIPRPVIAENVLAIIAQRLLKCLCPYCKKIEPITAEEKEMLSSFVTDFPEKVGHPVGCRRCSRSGYLGRTGLYEVVYFDKQVAGLIRDNVPISEIRKMLRDRGDFLIFTHAMEKIRDGICSVPEIFAGLLIEEVPPAVLRPRGAELYPPDDLSRGMQSQTAEVLLLAEESEASFFLRSALEARGYRVDHPADLRDAIVSIADRPYSLIIADPVLKDLDGLKLLELIQQKALELPVIFLTSGPQEEALVLSYGPGGIEIIRKPVDMTELLTAVRRLQAASGLAASG